MDWQMLLVSTVNESCKCSCCLPLRCACRVSHIWFQHDDVATGNFTCVREHDVRSNTVTTYARHESLTDRCCSCRISSCTLKNFKCPQLLLRHDGPRSVAVQAPNATDRLDPGIACLRAIELFQTNLFDAKALCTVLNYSKG